MSTLVIATRNRHKAGEIQAVLGDGFSYLTLADLPTAPVVVEDAPTFAGNAAKKAVELARWLAGIDDGVRRAAWWVLADDSGLEVDALDGAPGVRSARFAAANPGQSGNSSDADNNTKLLGLLATTPPERRTARFRCVIALVALVAPDGGGVFDGACEGHILFEPRGQAGFGYDPLFQPIGFEQTFAELGEAVKNRISHRAQALAKLQAWRCPPPPAVSIGA